MQPPQICADRLDALPVLVGYDHQVRHELAIVCEGREDRAAAFEYEEGVVLVVADGAGGTSRGAQAAEAVVAEVGRTGWSPLADRWVDLFGGLDRTVGPGQSTAVVVAVGPDHLAGASVGDSEAWWFGPTERQLTLGQLRKPLLGDGAAVPVGFHLDLRAPGTLLLGTDGLWKYARRETIRASLRESPADAARRLVDSLRYPSGALPDDVAVVVGRFT